MFSRVLWSAFFILLAVPAWSLGAQTLPGDPFGTVAAGPEEDASGVLEGGPSASSGRTEISPAGEGTDYLIGDPLAPTGAASPESRGPEQAGSPKIVTFGGYIESKSRLSVTGGDPLALNLKAQLELTAKKENWLLYGSVSGGLEGAGHYWPGSHSRSFGRLRELYLTYDSEHFDFWVGKKRHHWGTSDGYNPLDLFNPLDLSDPFISARALNRIPQWMAGLDVSFFGLDLEAVALPKAGVITMPETGQPWEPRAYRELRQLSQRGLLTLAREGKPGRFFKDGTIGAKLSGTFDGLDVSVMGFRGYHHEPLMRLNLGPTGLTASGEYERFTAWGLAWAKGLGSQTLRGEVVIKPDFPVQGPAGWDRARLFQGVAGWDRDFDGRFYLNLQYLAEFQSRAGPIPRDDRQGFTYEASVRWASEAFKAGARGQVYTTGDGSLNELFLEYSHDDHFTFSVGLMLFGGQKTGVLGQYGENGFVYLAGRCSF
jgi:hypothetical protein